MTAKAKGSASVTTMLACLVISAIGYSLYVTDQQSNMIHQDHMAINKALMTMNTSIADITKSNDNLFLTTMMSNESKAALPAWIQERARSIVENRAQLAKATEELQHGEAKK